jgi:hypothetical protein
MKENRIQLCSILTFAEIMPTQSSSNKQFSRRKCKMLMEFVPSVPLGAIACPNADFVDDWQARFLITWLLGVHDWSKMRYLTAWWKLRHHHAQPRPASQP